MRQAENRERADDPTIRAVLAHARTKMTFGEQGCSAERDGDGSERDQRRMGKEFDPGRPPQLAEGEQTGISSIMPQKRQSARTRERSAGHRRGVGQGRDLPD